MINKDPRKLSTSARITSSEENKLNISDSTYDKKSSI